MKKIISILLITFMLLYLVSCAELISTETQEVEATVTDVDYEGAWSQPVWTGEMLMLIPYPAQYKVTFTYENVTLTVDDKDLYDFYKDNVGATVKCDLIIEYYDDGSIEQTLKLKED